MKTTLNFLRPVKVQCIFMRGMERQTAFHLLKYQSHAKCSHLYVDTGDKTVVEAFQHSPLPFTVLKELA